MNYAVGNSVLHRVTYSPTYAEILKLVAIRSYHTTSFPPLMHALNTVIGCLYETTGLVLEKGECIIFNYGINDCLCRKDRVGHIKLYEIMTKLSNGIDEVGHYYYSRALSAFRAKQDDELIQFLSIPEFEQHTRTLLGRFPGRGIVLGVNYFERSNPNIGWAFSEIEATNAVLRGVSREFGMVYIDNWTRELRDKTYDGVHYNIDGHKYISDKIRVAITELGGCIDD